MSKNIFRIKAKPGAVRGHVLVLILVTITILLHKPAL